ncbi:mucin-4-like isoform X5 [Strigops habroptila]|uniref:mucin-4-like isoform X5 n=1 Tax=Strigops habroptila TaxID=2489341 RepID=UPI0011CF9F0C|nr:mucin-4-like isoform X5 [Strigops habroptila]
MGTRGWTLSTFVGCCIWILHGLGAAAALPFTTEGPFSAGTASPITAESKGPSALVVGTAETSTVAADAETVETTLMESPPSPTFPPGAEPDAVVTGASKYTSTAPTWTNVTKPLNTSQDFERGLTAPAAATTAAAISAQHPTITPEAELDVTAAAPGTPLGTTPLFAGMKEDIAAVAREGEDLNPSTAAKSLPTIPPPAAAWEAQPTAGSPVGAGVTMLPSQGLTTAAGAVEEGVTLPLDIQSKDSANSSSPSPSTGGLLTAQQDRAVSGAVGITPEPVGEITPAAEGSPSASVPGDAGDAVNGEFSPPASTFLPLESPTASGTVGNLWEPSVLPDQAVLSPTTLLAPAGSEDWEGQGAPGSALSPAASEAPKATEDTAISLLSPGVPTDVLSDTNPPVLATALPRGDMGAVRLAKPSPWQTPTGEQPPLLAAALPFPSAPGAPYPPLGTAYPLPGAAYPPPGTGAGTLPAADDGAETPASPDLSAARGAPMSPSLGGTQPLETAAGAPQDADGARLNSASDAPNPASFVPDGLAWPAAGVQDEGAEGAGDTAQSGGSGNGSPYSDTQTDTNPSAFSVQQDPANTGELPTGGTEALANAELSPLSALGDGAGAAPALGQGPLPGPAPPGSAGLEPGVLEAEGPGGSAPVAAYPPPGAAAGPVSGSETPASPDLSAGEPQGAPVPPSFGESQPLGMAAGAPQGAGLPGANGSSTSLTSAWDAPSSAAYGPAGPSSPALGVQAGTNVGLPAAEEHGAGPAEQALGGAGSGAGFEPPLVSAAGSGTVAGKDQLPGAGSLSGPASPSDVVAAPSVSEGGGAGPIPAAALGPDSLSLASPDTETGSELALVQGAESRGDAAQAGNPEKPYTETSPSAFSVQQDPANTGELPTGGTEALANAKLSPLSALGDGAGAEPALGQGPLPGPAPPGSAGLEPGVLEAEGPGGSAPVAAYPPPGAAAGPVSGSETPASPDLSAGEPQGAPVPPSFGESQPLGMAAGAPQGAGLPGANGSSTSLTSAWDAPSSAAYGPAGPSSPALGVQAGTNVGLPTAEEHGAGPAEQALGGAGSGAGFEPPLVSAAGSGTVAGKDQLPGAGSSSGPASPSGAVAASSVLDPSSPSSSGPWPPSLGAGPGVPPAAGEGAGEAAGDRGSSGQSQAPAREGPAASGAPDGEMSTVLQFASSSPSIEGSSSPGTAVEAANGASLPGAGGAGGALSTALGAPGPEERPVPAPGIQSGASPGLSDAQLSQANVVELPGGSSVNGGPSPGASLGEGAGAIMQKTSGAPAPSALPSPQETQPLVPVAPDSSSISNDMATSPAASLPLSGHGLSSGLAPNGDSISAPGTQSGSRPLMPGAQRGLAGDAGGAQTWSFEDEVASGMPAPLGEVSPRAPASPGAALELPSAPQRENAAEGVSTNPGLSAPLLAFAAVPLYQYGARENDRQYVERRVDFNSPLFKPETGFPFGKTLRDSLYFTDNGQIIFPASDNSIFTYPNPPPSGFNGHEEVPIIAVFWDNADFSRGVGTTYYQEYFTLNTAKPPFVRDVEAKVRRYLKSSYSAVWTLKITWERAPAYTARTDTHRTITYQAVLTTDGFRSYVLMLYQEGGMQWDYTRLAATNVLIGYTSGDGFYHNDDLTQRPPATKYRPDQFRGYNTDLRGLWIYKLESRVGVNYRLKCLAWTGRQQEPRAWTQGLPACPCSLQQGQQDPRFKSSRGGWWAARVSMLHSASPNQHGAGIRCLYDSQSQLIEGRQERYWRSFRQTSPYRDQELKFYDWCCNQAGSAHLCARYSEKRPKIGCGGYQLPGMGSSEESESYSEEQRGGEDE